MISTPLRCLGLMCLAIGILIGPMVWGPARAGQIPAGGSWTNGGASISTPVTINSAIGSYSDFAAINTSGSTTYYIEFFPATGPNVTLGTTAPIWMMVVPPGPGGAVEHFTYLHSYTPALSVAVVTSPGGSSAAPASTCWASVSARS